MNIRLTATLAMTLASISFATPTAAQAQQRAAITQLDVAGIRLGMTPDEAGRAIAKSGYKIDAASIRDDRPSWEERLRVAVRERQGSSAPRPSGPPLREVSNYYATSVRKQTLQVSFAATPAGPRVKKVVYEIPVDQITKADFDANVLTKYGRRDGQVATVDGMEALWCSAGERQCGKSWMYRPERPVLKAGTFQVARRHRITLDGRDIAEEARLNSLFVAEVERRAPRTRETSF